jgi:hypothetical protein
MGGFSVDGLRALEWRFALAVDGFGEGLQMIMAFVLGSDAMKYYEIQARYLG